MVLVCFKQHFVLHLDGSRYYLLYTFKAVHVLGILAPGTSLQTTLEVVKLVQIYFEDKIIGNNWDVSGFTFGEQFLSISSLKKWHNF